MSRNLPEELISAYFDGELSPEERADFLRELRASGEQAIELEQKLHELRQMSDRVQSLPSHPAPANLLSAVMARIQEPSRNSELGLAGAAESNGVAHPVSPRLVPPSVEPRSHRGLWQGLASIIVTAVALLVMVQLFQQEETPIRPLPESLRTADQDRLDFDRKLTLQDGIEKEDRERFLREVPDPLAATPEPQTQMKSELILEAEDVPTKKLTTFEDGFAPPRDEEFEESRESLGDPKLLVQRENLGQGSRAVLPGIVQKPTGEKSVAGFPGRNEAVPPQSHTLQPNSSPIPALTEPSELVLAKTLEDLKVGQAIDLMETEGNQVVVVRLTVIDRQQGLENLHLLLSRHRIPSQVAVASTSEEMEQQALPEKSRSSGAELVGVYVQTSSDQLNLALKELQNQNNIQSVELEAPVEMADLKLPPRLSGELTAQMDKAIRLEEFERAEDPQPLAFNLPREELPAPAPPAVPEQPSRLKEDILEPKPQSFALDELHQNGAKIQQQAPEETAPFTTPALPNLSSSSPGIVGNPLAEQSGTEPAQSRFDRSYSEMSPAEMKSYRQIPQPRILIRWENESVQPVEEQKQLAQKDQAEQPGRQFNSIRKAEERSRNQSASHPEFEFGTSQQRAVPKELLGAPTLNRPKKSSPLQVLFIVVSGTPSSQVTPPAILNPTSQLGS